MANLGSIIKRYKKKLPEYEKLRYCRSCVDNFYNDNNPYGIKKCWHLGDAYYCQKEFYYDLNSNHTYKEKTLSCCSKPW